MKILRCAWDPALLGAVRWTEAATHRAQACLPDRVSLGEAMRMGMSGALMVTSTLVLLVTVVSYDPTPCPSS